MRFVELVLLSLNLAMAEDELLFFGSYTNHIQTYLLSADSYKLTHIATCNSGDNPSWLTLSKSKKFLFAVNEVNDYNGEYSGAISSFRVEEGGNLTLISRYNPFLRLLINV